ncbi:hypothetical protein ACN47E_006856 [Coniothyrium glycines]
MSTQSIVLVTGGNTGIGYETIKALYASSEAYTILMGSRSLDKANAAVSALINEVTESRSEIALLQIDIEDDASIERAFEEVKSKYGRIDTLVNNAGGSFDQIAVDNPTPAGIREAWNRGYNLNTSSTQVVTHVFAPLLLKSSSPRLLFVTSGLSSLTTCSGGANALTMSGVPQKGWPKPPAFTQTAYRSSKTALNMQMLEWKRILEVDGVKVFAISPGFLATNLGGKGKEFLRKAGAGDASKGGIFIKNVVEGKRDADVGKVIDDKDGVQPW